MERSLFGGEKVTNTPGGVRRRGAPRASTEDGTSCLVVAVHGGIRPSQVFEMELHDPKLGRSLHHRYVVEILPEIA
jgi:hypothetical protein